MKKTIILILNSDKVENWVLILIKHLSNEYDVKIKTLKKTSENLYAYNDYLSKSIIRFEQKLSQTLKNNWYDEVNISSLNIEKKTDDAILINLSDQEYTNCISIFCNGERLSTSNIVKYCYLNKGVEVLLYSSIDDDVLLSYKTSNNNDFLTSRKNNLIAAVCDLIYYTIIEENRTYFNNLNIDSRHVYSAWKYIIKYPVLLFLTKLAAFRNNKKWHIGIKYPNNTFEILKQPKGEFWADPFLMHIGNKPVIAFERMHKNTSIGVISIYELESNSHKDVLVEPFHLSFPYPFYLNNTHYVIPETKQSREIRLYQLDNISYSLKYVSTLIENIESVDNVIFEHDNYLWMFCTVKTTPLSNSGDVLMIYFSDKLAGSWKKHPLNPVKLDNSSTRNAGLIFKEDDKLFRPVQNCSTRYGGSVKIMEITKLTTTEFEEVEFKEIFPQDFHKSAFAFHTYTKTNGYTVVDLLLDTKNA